MQHALYRAAKADPTRRFHALFDKVCRRDVLDRAWQDVRRNHGAAGIDQTTLADVERYGVARLLDELAAELKEQRYRPLPARRVFIPKPGSTEQRPLSIPSVRDRIVQAAVRIVLEPIFEADMLDCSFGFRPKRSPHDALQALIDESWRGHRWVVETDIANCFEAIPHSGLMQAIKERVCDRAVLDLVHGMLRAGVMEAGSLRRGVAGTPQGGVVTPPTQQITWGGFGACDRDAVPDDHAVGADEDLLDQQAEHPLALWDRGRFSAAAQPRQEAFKVLGELQVGRLVDELGVQGVDLGMQGLLLGA